MNKTFTVAALICCATAFGQTSQEHLQNGITKHIGNIFKEGELGKKSNVQNLHVSGFDKPVKFYNLNVIISVGYSVKSHRGVQFRQRAKSSILFSFLQGRRTMEN